MGIDLDSIAGKAQELAGGLIDKAKEVAPDLVEKASDIANDITEQAPDVLGKVKEAAGSAAEGAKNFVEEAIDKDLDGDGVVGDGK